MIGRASPTASIWRWRDAPADAALLLGIAFLFPLVIIVIGAPIALLVRVAMAVVRVLL